ncbi:MAG: NfeD family protein [Acidobacteria bacterium]|nr:NfeD family protein [Acidobacteriota bacterium]
MTWWMWILAGLVLLGVEVAAPGGIILLFFGAAALVVGILMAVGVVDPVWLQWLLFSILSIVSLVTLRGPILRRVRARPRRGEEIDSLVGQEITALGDLSPGGDGKVELRGTSWSAKNIGESAIGQGGKCRVERVKGLILFVRAS